MSAMKAVVEEFRALVTYLEAEGHAKATEFRALFHKVTGEPVAEPTEPAKAADASEEGPTT